MIALLTLAFAADAADVQLAPDDALKAVFGGKERVTMFEMTKLVSQHIQS